MTHRSAANPRDSICIEVRIQRRGTDVAAVEVRIGNLPNSFYSKMDRPIVAHLPPGTHDIQATTSDGVTHRRRIELNPGDGIKPIFIELTETPS